jgi:hypothetical protein
MSKFATRLLTLAIYSAALAVVPMVTPAQAGTSHSKHLKKHARFQTHQRFGDPWYAHQAWPNHQTWPAAASSSVPTKTCFRAFECAKWPPPFDEDPDRKVSGTDN